MDFEVSGLAALIVGGIFTMFYMKAYFQKPVAVAVSTRTKSEMSSNLLEAV